MARIPREVAATREKVAVKEVDTPFEASQDANFAVPDVNYSEKEIEYRRFLLQRLTEARNKREASQVFYNGLTYTENYRSNMLAGNSYTAPRVNAEDTQVVTGTTREKVLAIVSAVLNLNFETAFRAFDEDDIEDESLGEAMTDVVERANYMELWDEKKIYAYMEMAVQGDVYIEENYVEEVVSDKPRMALGNISADDYKKDYTQSTKSQSFAGCRRDIIPGPQVYKGSMTIRDLNEQPFIFTREVKSYEYAKSLYGHIPRFKMVPRQMQPVEGGQQDDILGINWRLEPISDETCEILKYSDRFNKEYQIIINGVMLLPMSYGLPWSYDGYNLTQGRLEPISPFFSESKSVPAKTKLDQEILDEMYRLAVLKTQKSFMPPIANFTNNILSRSMFLPGKVNNNLVKGDIEVLGGDPSQYSMKPSEFEMIKMVKQFIDEKSVDPVLQGQNPGGDPTATQINTVTQQAKQRLGVLIYGFIQFHQNLDTLRLYTVLDNYTKETGTKANELKTGIENKYRTITINKDLGAKGMGVKKIQFTEKHDSPASLYDQQEGIERDDSGKPTSINPPKTPMRIMQISPKMLGSIKYSWYAQTTPTERDTSVSSRIEFEDHIMKAMQLFGPQSINLDYAQQQWAIKNKIKFDSFFVKKPAGMGALPGGVPPGTLGAAGPGTGIEGMGPAQESNMTKANRPYGGGGASMRAGMG